MELTSAQLKNIQTLTVTSGKINPENLPKGDQIVAKIAAIDPESGEVTLKINDKLVIARALLALSTQLKAGQRLQLTVAQSSANKIILQLPQTLIDNLTQQKALREALPKQQPVSDTIIQIKALIQGKKNSLLPEKIIQFAKKIMSRLPTPAQLSTPEGVKKAIQQSGVFLEAKLANMTVTNDPTKTDNKNITNDIKALLLGFKNLLSKEKSLSETEPKAPMKPDTKTTASSILVSPAVKQIKIETTTLKSDITGTTLQTTLNKNINQPTLAKSIPALDKAAASNKNEQVDLKKTTDIDQRALAASINETKKSRLVTDNQINQVLSNLLNSKKKPGNNTLTPLPLNDKMLSTTPSAIDRKPMQRYATKESLNTNNEIALSAIKSQNVSDVTPPRLNNLIDLIETLIKQVDAAISRTQVHQLNAAIDQENGKMAMSLEIPVNDDDNLHLVQLHIEKEPNPENENETVVTVNLAIDLDAIGSIYARITLVNENTSVVLWAERKTTFQLVEQSVNLLHTKLEASGLKPDNIACHHGQPPQDQFIAADKNTNLLDVRA